MKTYNEFNKDLNKVNVDNEILGEELKGWI